MGRLFNAEVGGQIAWLLPVAAVGLLVGLWITRRAPREDRARAGYVLWGLWAFYELSEEDRKQLLKDNPVINALAQAQQRGKGNAAGQRGPMTVQVNPLTGQVGPANSSTQS